mmetsp:Transcript_34484/g.90221  ORF Transcript_34484/g.90221 Transcript_34484/m.90221 type:complete len:237 (-) Transcript_34484:38-748(-)
MKRRRRHSITLVSLQHFLRGRRLDLLKIDIDNSAIEVELIVALERMAAAQQTDVRAFVIEVSASSARDGRAKPLSRALSRLQQQGYHAYRLAHHLHQMDDLEPYYSPCYGVRAIKCMLHIRPLRCAAEAAVGGGDVRRSGGAAAHGEWRRRGGLACDAWGLVDPAPRLGSPPPHTLRLTPHARPCRAASQGGAVDAAAADAARPGARPLPGWEIACVVVAFGFCIVNFNFGSPTSF